MIVRPAQIETDIPGIVAVVNAYEPLPVTAENVEKWFRYNPPGRVALRLVSVDAGGAVTGYGFAVHEPAEPEGRFTAWVGVEPSCCRRGAGAALWNALLEFLAGQGAGRVVSDVRDNDPVGLGFAERRGFSVERQGFSSVLDLDAFDETPYLPAIAALEAQGIRFCSLADFADTQETRRKLYELNELNRLDMPGNAGTTWPFDEFEHYVIEADWFRRDGQLLAVDGERWVGLAAVMLTPNASEGAYNAHTGVLSEYRGRKIAQSLKVLAARFARQSGAHALRTDNDSTNRPILAINTRMGYRPQPGKYFLVCQIQGAEKSIEDR